jgi:hypothetical protein
VAWRLRGRDANDQALAYVYNTAARTDDEAPRIAANIAELPELLKCVG